MGPIDAIELSLHVKQRMDELFPNGDAPAAGAEPQRGAADFSLSCSRRIAQALGSKSQLTLIREYLNELGKLSNVFSRDRHLRVIIQVQTTVCRYLLKNPRQLDSASLALISEGFAGMERLSADAPTPASEKDLLVRALVRDFHDWKEAVLAAGSASRAASDPGVQTTPRPRGDAAVRPGASSRASGAVAYYMIEVEDLDDLKRLFQQEIVRLRKELLDRLRLR